MNNGASTTLAVCVREHVACVKIAGRANFTSSVDFKRLVLQLLENGCREIVLDLSDCRLMDSTFLGVLAGLGSTCEAKRNSGGACSLELFHPTDRIVELLDNLGVLGRFRLIDDAPAFTHFKPVEEGNTTRLELNRTCYEAHKTLMDMSPENERRFKDATAFLEKNLRDSEGK